MGSFTLLFERTSHPPQAIFPLHESVDLVGEPIVQGQSDAAGQLELRKDHTDRAALEKGVDHVTLTCSKHPFPHSNQHHSTFEAPSEGPWEGQIGKSSHFFHTQAAHESCLARLRRLLPPRGVALPTPVAEVGLDLRPKRLPVEGLHLSDIIHSSSQEVALKLVPPNMVREQLSSADIVGQVSEDSTSPCIASLLSM